MTEAIQDALLDIATRPDVTPFRAKLLLKDAGMPNAATRLVSGPGDELFFRLDSGAWTPLEDAL
jgi:hypothetical protein